MENRVEQPSKNKHVEALMLKLTGKDADKYDIYYRVHAQNYGWLAWAKNGEAAGTSGYAYRLEAIQIVVTAKGDMAPTVFYGGYTSNNAKAYISKTSTVPIINTNASVRYQSHVSNIGWQSAVENGSLSGTTGRNLGLEAIKIDLDGQPCSGGIKYQTHVQNIGWQNTVMDGALAGTTGRGSECRGNKYVSDGRNGKSIRYLLQSTCTKLRMAWMGKEWTECRNIRTKSSFRGIADSISEERTVSTWQQLWWNNF